MPFAAAVFDVDGVIVDSPHEQAWREALQGFADPKRFTTAIYQAYVAGKPRLMGARAALEQLGVPDAENRAVQYAEQKQKRILDLIEARCFVIFPDALRFIRGVRARGLRVAVASSSKNANRMMELIRVGPKETLLDLCDANLCGRDVRRGKPDPEIFLLAAAQLGITPSSCFVVEDAPAGIHAAKAAGMTALGVARHEDTALLQVAGADLVVSSLDDVAIDALPGSRLAHGSSKGTATDAARAGAHQ